MIQINLFALASFLSAWLVFLVQPMVSKVMLPYLGGSAQVWSTALMVFQFLLLAGYAYAFTLTRFAKLHFQCFVHGLLCITVLLNYFPLDLNLSHFQVNTTNPTAWVVGLLLQTIGLPFLLLSATAPLLQYWFAKSNQGASPYPLYSASNIGSILALLSYPLLIERLLDNDDQARLWSLALALFMATLGYVVYYSFEKADKAIATPDISEAAPKVTWKQRKYWIWLAFLPCSLMMGVTSYITTDIASAPMLWVIPLLLYLVSIILVFSEKSPRILAYCERRSLRYVLLVAMVLLPSSPLFILFLLCHLAAFFVLSTHCHAKLYANKPAAHQAPDFYLCMSIGGAFSGVFNVLIAPALFTDALEYPLIIGLTAITLASTRASDFRARNWLKGAVLFVALIIFWTVGLFNLANTDAILGVLKSISQSIIFFDVRSLIYLILAMPILWLVRYWKARALRRTAVVFTLLMIPFMPSIGRYDADFAMRNFFGIYRISYNKTQDSYVAHHNTTVHGVQSVAAAYRMKLTSYYWPLETHLLALPEKIRAAPAALVGLGVGTSLCAFHSDQHVDVFELDPDVLKIATNEKYFTYYRDCPPQKKLVIGDARLGIANQPNYRYGIIILDAFSSDAIPSHLLTEEAIDMYFERLVKDGVIFFHISNRHLDLGRLLASYAKRKHYAVARAQFNISKKESNNPKLYKVAANWVIMAKSSKALQPLLAKKKFTLLKEHKPIPLWTDRYSNILAVLK